YPTVPTLHVVQTDSLGQLNSHLVINIRRRSRPRSSDQVLLLRGISGQLGLEPGGASALVALQHTDENGEVALIHLLASQHRSHTLEGHRPDREQLHQVAAGAQFLPGDPPGQTVRRSWDG